VLPQASPAALSPPPVRSMPLQPQPSTVRRLHGRGQSAPSAISSVSSLFNSARRRPLPTQPYKTRDSGAYRKSCGQLKHSKTRRILCESLAARRVDADATGRALEAGRAPIRSFGQPAPGAQRPCTAREARANASQSSASDKSAFCPMRPGTP
jgi:hypothetical protein